MNRHFFDWAQPLLPVVAEWLLDGAAPRAGVIDLQRVACVLPGRRAGRLLLGCLLEAAERRGMQWMPPQVMTPPDLIDRLLPAAGPVAGEAERAAAWFLALRSDLPRPDLAPLLDVRAAEHWDDRAWLDLARQLDRAATEVQRAGHALAAVSALCHELVRPAEAERWHVIARAAECAARRLAEAGLESGVTEQWQRLEAWPSGIPGAPQLSRIVAVGCAEWSGLERALLERCADLLDVLVHAEAHTAHAFDAMGAPQTGYWNDAALSLRDRDIAVVETPVDQAHAVLEAMRTFQITRHTPEGHSVPADEISIGLCDPHGALPMQRVAQAEGLQLHTGAGMPIGVTAPFVLLERVRQWLRDRDAPALAALLRAHGAEALHSGSGDDTGPFGAAACIRALEEYRAATMDEALRAVDDLAASGGPNALLAAVTTALLRRVRIWLGDVCDESLRCAAASARPLVDLLRSAFGALRPGHPDDAVMAAACLMLVEECSAAAQMPPALDPGWTVAGTLDLILDSARHRSVPDPLAADGTDVLGWLELPFDAAPAMIICGANEGSLPEGDGHDHLLPELLRRALHLPGTQERAARDAYRLEAILRSRPFVRVICGRTTGAGDPLLPSRLLLRCDDTQLPSRVRWLSQVQRSAPALAMDHRTIELAGGDVVADGTFPWRDVPTLPASMAVPPRLRVTDFARFLRCPYRFALERLLRVDEPARPVPELEPHVFGTLAHEVLRVLGESAVARTDFDADALATVLGQRLREEARQRFGAAPPAVVQLQLAQLRARLNVLAERHAQMLAERWEVVATECDLADVSIDVPGDIPMAISGRVDRVDRRIDGEVCRLRIIDYKTSERAVSPVSRHLGVKDARKAVPGDDGHYAWRDLQLPLYLALLPRMPWFRALSEGWSDVQVEAGYMSLPSEASRVAFEAAHFSAAQLDDALIVAGEITARIRAIAVGGTVPPPTNQSAEFDPFARICRTLVAGGQDDGPEEDAEEGEAAA